MIKPALLPLLMLLASGASTLSQAAEGPLSLDAVRGKQLYYAHGCYGCHGYSGQTGARDLVGTGSALVASEAVFRLFLRQRGDQSPVLPVTRMPNYARTALSDAQVHDLYAYVSSLRLNAPALEQVPTFRDMISLASKPYKP